MISMVSNTGPANLWFRALVEFERDLLPVSQPPRQQASIARHSAIDVPVLLQSRGVGSAQSPNSRPPSGGGCAEGVSEFDFDNYRCHATGLSLSQLSPLERV